ncbi:MAG TPA: HAD family phosphatase [Parvibaculum sp.]
MPRAVIFDMGNVLIGWDPQTPYRRHLPDDGALADFFAGFFRTIYNAVHDDPRPIRDCLAPLKEAHPDKLALIEVYEHEWASFLTGPMAESVEILQALAARGVALYGLTNWPHQVWPPSDHVHEDARAGYAFLGLFRDVVVSGQVGLRKPDGAIYLHALERFGLAASDAVFVDDLAENIEAANALGMTGILFRDAADLRVRLQGLGLID